MKVCDNYTPPCRPEKPLTDTPRHGRDGGSRYSLLTYNEVSFPDRPPRPGSALTWVDQARSGSPFPRRANSGLHRSAPMAGYAPGAAAIERMIAAGAEATRRALAQLERASPSLH
jgi:hypothetical protein